ncbi:MAG TPA: hypothetical protein VM076_03020 [Gemmatimonadaceae bacterium]|nr:hypothetical protein [Gemmatimonadaceae bacterium]
MASNDYGFELLSPTEPPLAAALESSLFSPENLVDDIQAALNATEMARRQFRELALEHLARGLREQEVRGVVALQHVEE